jgi:hypothetical protein
VHPSQSWAHMLTGTCANCGKQGRVQVDHVVPRFEGGLHDWSNLQPLCAPCHKLKTDAELERLAASRRGVQLVVRNLCEECGVKPVHDNKDNRYCSWDCYMVAVRR